MMMDMMDSQWIVVRDRQGDLLAEAEAERLARLVKDAAGRDGSSLRINHAARQHPHAIADDGYAGRSGVISTTAGATGALLAAVRVDVGRRLIEVGAALAAEPKLVDDCDCSEAA
jgi:hypothetical protein